MLGDTERAWQVYQAQVHPGGAWGPALERRHRRGGLPVARRAGRPRPQAVACGTRSTPTARNPFPSPASPSSTSTARSPRSPPAIATASRPTSPSSSSAPPPAARPQAMWCRGWPAALPPTATATGPKAIAVLEPALAETVRIGGSRAQRDLIENTLLAAYLKAGREADARRLLAGAHRPAALGAGRRPACVTTAAKPSDTASGPSPAAVGGVGRPRRDRRRRRLFGGERGEHPAARSGLGLPSGDAADRGRLLSLCPPPR